jgi:uncharacterized membrane protein YeaQ/YmgE (transglycosylase-associated protein family)
MNLDPLVWLTWIIVGVIAGWLANLVMRKRIGLPENLLTDIVGALIGGSLFNVIGLPGAAEFRLWSVLVSIVGAVFLLGVLRLFQGKQNFPA